MLRSDVDHRHTVDPDDVKDFLRGLAFLALLGLGLYVNLLLN